MFVDVFTSDYTNRFNSNFVKDLNGLSNSIRLIAKTEEERLFVRFNNGSEYVYCNVSDEEINEILSSSSIGKAFRERVINNLDRYPYSKVSELSESEIKMLGLEGVICQEVNQSVIDEARNALLNIERTPLF